MLHIRLKRLGCIFVALTALLASCGNGSDQAQTVEAPSTTAGSGSDDSASTTFADDATNTSAPPATSLDAVVIKLEDLPAGWTNFPAEGPDDDDTSLCNDLDPLGDAEPVEEAASQFRLSDFGPFLSSDALRYGSEEDAEALFNAFVDAVNSCTEFTEVDDNGTETEYRFEPLSFPSVGDETFAARLLATTMLGPLAVDFVIAVKGDVVLSIANGGFGAADTALTESSLRTMADRL